MTSSNNFYQQTVRDIYEAITRETSVETLKVEYSASIEGKTSTHEADVYWEFTDGQITYKTVIRAIETTTLAELFSFLRTVRDIPGQTTGVVVTQPIYQKDIKNMAASAGIILYELIAPVQKEVWEPVISNIGINVDKEWVAKEKERVGLGDEPVQVTGNPKYAFLYDERGNCVDSVEGVFNSYSKKGPQGEIDRRSITHVFDSPAFLQTNHELVPFVKLTDISFDLEFINANILPGEEIVQSLIAQVLKYFGH